MDRICTPLCDVREPLPVPPLCVLITRVVELPEDPALLWYLEAMGELYRGPADPPDPVEGDFLCRPFPFPLFPPITMPDEDPIEKLLMDEGREGMSPLSELGVCAPPPPYERLFPAPPSAPAGDASKADMWIDAPDDRRELMLLDRRDDAGGLCVRCAPFGVCIPIAAAAAAADAAPTTIKFGPLPPPPFPPPLLTTILAGTYLMLELLPLRFALFPPPKYATRLPVLFFPCAAVVAAAALRCFCSSRSRAF